MRTQEYHHGTKPYEYPQATSKVFGGVTRIVESEESHASLYRRLYTTLQPANGQVDGNQIGDVDLCDVTRWLNRCKRDPKFLNDFVEDCQNEFSKKEILNLYNYRANRNFGSDTSSQFTSPAQSPSERSLTSPESVTFEESSLYYSRSPNIPSFDNINIRSVESEDVNKRALPVDERNYCLNIGNENNIEPNPDFSNEARSQSSDSAPNIGTVMLNLAEDPFESTIDLNQFASVCDTYSSNEGEVLPTIERDTLNDKLDPKAKENAWARISQLDIDLLGKGDNEGDT